MIYLVPAWYKQNSWNGVDQCWYIRRAKTEYDDTVKQMQLFHRSKMWPYQLLILSYTPNLRHFLHRQGMYRANYWSCFDAMMEVERKKVAVFSYKDANWPKGIVFEYTSFAVVAYLNHEKYAQIEFGEDGNLIQIDMYKEGKKVRTNYYDDRGFVSGSIVYEDEKWAYQDYLMENGIWKLRQYADGHVEVNPKYNTFIISTNESKNVHKYKKLSYTRLGDVIGEVLCEYIKQAQKKDIFCVAAHNVHNSVLNRSLYGKIKIISFFEDRLKYEKDMIDEAVKDAKYVIADTSEHIGKISELVGNRIPMVDISPYDTRIDYGISQQFSEYKILVPVDNMKDELFQKLIAIFCEYFYENEKAVVHFFTRQTEYDRKDRIINRTKEILDLIGEDERLAIEKSDTAVAENDLDRKDEVTQRFFVKQCVDELSVNRCIREQRMIVDLREGQDIFLQIAAISAAIPQVGIEESKYLISGENGLVIESDTKLINALRYYLDGLSNWNEAMICASEIGKQFSTQALLEKWKEVIDTIGQN